MVVCNLMNCSGYVNFDQTMMTFTTVIWQTAFDYPLECSDLEQHFTLINIMTSSLTDQSNTMVNWMVIGNFE